MAFITVLVIISIICALITWIFNKRVIMIEAIGSILLTLIVGGMVYGAIYHVLIADTQIISGKVIEAVYEPEWIEEYEEAHHVTHTVGKTTYTTTYYTTEHRTHHRNWYVKCNYGRYNDTYHIPELTYLNIVRNFGGSDRRLGSRPGFDGGDRYDYYAVNTCNFVYPVHTTIAFDNKMRICKTVFSYADVPKDAKVFTYPTVTDVFRSNRLLGTAKADFNQFAFDQLNATLGPTKRVNLIIIGFDNADPIVAQWQEAAWIGGKRNDLVICYDRIRKWCYVFGWTESTLVKRNIETLLITKPINDTLLPELQREIIANYELKNWQKFDYLTVAFPLWGYILIFLLTLGAQVVYYCFIINNEIDKE